MMQKTVALVREFGGSMTCGSRRGWCVFNVSREERRRQMMVCHGRLLRSISVFLKVGTRLSYVSM